MSPAVVSALVVIPAKAGIQEALVQGVAFVWIPAFAGMTEEAKSGEAQP